MKKYVTKISRYKPSILQGTLHLEAARPRQSLAIEHPYERRALVLLSSLLALLVVAYLYFVTASILHAAERVAALKQIQKIDNSIGELEAHYFALSQEVSPQMAQTLGLTPISKTSYVYRPGNAAFAREQSSTL